MRDSSRLDDAYGQCRDAVFGIGSWDAALQSLAEAFGAESCVFKPCSGAEGSGVPLQLESTGHRPFSALWLARIEAAPDPHTDVIRKFPGTSPPCVIEHQLTSEEDRRKMPYFNEIARPGGRDWWACLRFRAMGATWGLPLYRGAARGPFDDTDIAFLTSQIAPLGGIAQAAQSVERRSAEARIGGLGDLGIPAFLADERGLAVAHNAALDALLGTGLSLRRGRLAAADAQADRDLAAFRRCLPSGPAGPAVIRKDGLPWLALTALPLGENSTQVFTGARAIVLVGDLAARIAPGAATLAAAFGLTPAEARLAARVATGAGLVEACRDLGIGRETGRSHLGAIFAKTGTSRQAELAALLTRFATLH